MLKSEYLNKIEIKNFVDWAAATLTGLCIHHHVKGRGRGVGHSFKVTGVEEAARQYDWFCNIDPDFLPNTYTAPEGNPKELNYNMAVLKWLRNELRESLSNNDAMRHFRACLATLSWGGVDNGARATNVRFYAAYYVKDNHGNGTSENSLLDYHRQAHLSTSAWAKSDIADDDIEKLKNCCSKMSAGITKIHALMDDELVIYDSRVAAVIGWLVELYCAEKGIEVIPDGLQFSMPEEQGKNEIDQDDTKKIRNPGHSSVRPKDSKIQYEYPTLRTNTPAEWMHYQLRSSWLLSGILDKNKLFQAEPDRANQFMLLQLGLFMIGYDLRQQGMV
jgi:hypothetical protein